MAIIFLSLLIGASLAMGGWCLLRLATEVPVEDRSYLDKPPVGFRLTWGLVNLLVHYLGRYLSRSYIDTTRSRLQKAGVQYSLSPEQFFAGKLIAAMAAGSFVFLLQVMLDKHSLIFVLLGAVGGFFYPEIWLKETMDTRMNKIFKALPFYLDVITLAVESGLNLTSGLNQAVQKAPEGPLRTEFSRTLRDIRAGKGRTEALRQLSDRVDNIGLSNVVSSMIQADKTGASLGPVLRAQSDQLRSTRFLRAEKMAMEAPVKLLGPLVAFIFPTTFLVIIFVIMSNALASGVITWEPLVWAFSNPGQG